MMQSKFSMARVGIMVVVIVVAMLGLMMMCAVPLNAETAAAITVNSTDEAVNARDGKCTLREAITAANTDAPSGNVPGECPAGNGADTIELTPSAEYGLSVVDNTDGTYGETGLPVIASEMTLNGNGATVERSTTEGTPEFRLMRIAMGAILHVNQLTLAGGDSTLNGSGIFNAGTLTLTGCTLTKNLNAYDTGGAIFSTGSVEIHSSTFSQNGESGGYPTVYGGAIANVGGTLTVTDSAFMNNVALYAGGAIYSTGTTVIATSTFTANVVTFNWFTGGGAISVEDAGTGTITDSRFVDNEAGVYGGALFAGGAVQVERSLFVGNVADGSHGSGGGGAIFGGANVSNSTFYRNHGGSFYSGGSAMAGSGTVVNSTFAENEDSARFTSHQALLGVTLKNSILFETSCAGVTDGGGNIGWPKSVTKTCVSAFGDPLLGVLQNNGGATETMVPGPASPALNAAVDANCPATDQRGVARPQGAHCDSGAVELEGPTAPVLQSPANAAHVTGGTRLEWTAGERTAAYLVVVRVDSRKGAKVMQELITATHIKTKALTRGHWYFWRVFSQSNVEKVPSGWRKFYVE